MKITDVSLTLFAWDDIPPTQYGLQPLRRLERARAAAHPHRRRRRGQCVPGLGLELGNDRRPGVDHPSQAGADGQGSDASRSDRRRPVAQAARLRRARHRRGRRGAVGSRRQGDGSADPSPARHFRESVPAYASSAVLKSPEAYAQEALEYKEYGWAAYKIHPPTRWQEDIKVCEAVRKAVGDYTIMLDSTWSYDYPAAVRVGRAAQDLGYFWYEDPLHDQDIYNYVKLKQALSIPILATEYPIAGLESYQPWIMLQATDFLRGDVAVKGGITTLVKTAHLAEAFRMNYEVHHGGNSLNNVANLHVIASIRNTTFFEVLLPDAAQKYGLEQDIVVGRDGMVHVPNGPGLGAAIDFKLIERKKVAVLS